MSVTEQFWTTAWIIDDQFTVDYIEGTFTSATHVNGSFYKGWNDPTLGWCLAADNWDADYQP
jgi:hypothetical protein